MTEDEKQMLDDKVSALISRYGISNLLHSAKRYFMDVPAIGYPGDDLAGTWPAIEGTVAAAALRTEAIVAGRGREVVR